MKAIFITLTLIQLIIGCDMLKSKEKNIVGNISVIDSNDEEGGRYYLTFYNEKRSFNSHIVEDFVGDIVGNDSILIVKCIDKVKCQDVYFEIKHFNGRFIKNVERLDSISYSKQKIVFDRGKYKFHTVRINCP